MSLEDYSAFHFLFTGSSYSIPKSKVQTFRNDIWKQVCFSDSWIYEWYCIMQETGITQPWEKSYLYGKGQI